MIRMATHEDVPQLVELGRAMHAESNYAPLVFDPARTANFVHWLIDEPDGFVACAERDGELVGFIAALAGPTWFGDGKQKTANDMGLYVRPANRRGTSAIFLVQAFKDWVLRNGFAQGRGGTNAGQAGQAANAIYEHLGFARAGHCFVMNNLPATVGQSFDGHLVVQ